MGRYRVPVEYQTPQDPFDSRGMSALPPAKRRRPRLLLVALAGLGLAAGIITLAALIPRLIGDGTTAQSVGNTSSSTGLSAETQFECTNIKHAYSNWYGGLGRLTKLQHQNAAVAEVDLKGLTEQSKAFMNAASGYKDQPSKDLAAKVGQYNFDVGAVQLELKLSGAITEGTAQKAIASWREADSSYSAFLALTCS